MYVQTNGTIATARAGEHGEPAQARAGHEQRRRDDRAEHERRPEVRLEHDEDERRSGEDARADDRPERAEPAHAAAEVARQDDDHQHLGELAELELQPEDRDPARGAADPAADRERDDEQPELHDVQRPRERLEPVVVERGRGQEHGERDRGPHHRPQERRSAVEDADARRGRVAVGHREPEAQEQRGVRRELEVERAPDGADAARDELAPARRGGRCRGSRPGWTLIPAPGSRGRGP